MAVLVDGRVHRLPCDLVLCDDLEARFIGSGPACAIFGVWDADPDVEAVVATCSRNREPHPAVFDPAVKEADNAHSKHRFQSAVDVFALTKNEPVYYLGHVLQFVPAAPSTATRLHAVVGTPPTLALPESALYTTDGRALYVFAHPLLQTYDRRLQLQQTRTWDVQVAAFAATGQGFVALVRRSDLYLEHFDAELNRTNALAWPESTRGKQVTFCPASRATFVTQRVPSTGPTQKEGSFHCTFWACDADFTAVQARHTDGDLFVVCGVANVGGQEARLKRGRTKLTARLEHGDESLLVRHFHDAQWLLAAEDLLVVCSAWAIRLHTTFPLRATQTFQMETEVLTAPVYLAGCLAYRTQNGTLKLFSCRELQDARRRACARQRQALEPLPAKASSTPRPEVAENARPADADVADSTGSEEHIDVEDVLARMKSAIGARQCPA